MEANNGLLVLSVFLGILHISAASECDGSSGYHVEIVGCPHDTPHPFLADRGVPFFHECEDDNEKCFGVQSGTDIALYLSPTASIDDPPNVGYYQIIITVDGDITIERSDGATLAAPVLTGSAPADNLLSGNSATYLCVSVVESDGTIHVSSRGSGFVLSWKDDDLMDVNYILVLKFNDPDESTAHFDFCNGAFKLLSQNNDQAAQLSVTGDNLLWDPSNGVDGEIPSDGQADSGRCTRIARSGGYAYWRLDLGDLYEIKGVAIADGYEYGCPKGWYYYGSACYWASDIGSGGTDAPLSWTAAQDDCIDKGGDLVSIRTPEIESFLEEWIDNTDTYWIGLNDMDTDGDFYWVSETNVEWGGGDSTHFTQFGGTPAGGQECVEWDVGTDWDDAACGGSNDYICQRSLCPASYRLFGDTCYRYHTEDDDRDGGQALCDNQDRGDLISVDTPWINGVLTDWVALFDDGTAAIGPRPWIGLYDPSADATDFRWEEYSGSVWVGGEIPDDGDGRPVGDNYVNWGTDEPEPTSTGGCVYYDWDTDEWYSWTTCTDVSDFICQIAPPAEESSLVGLEVFVGSCSSTSSLTNIKQNHACHQTVDAVDVGRIGRQNWIVTECGSGDCESKYYGRYVYVVSEVSTLTLCEVEVWGREITNKPTVKFTATTLEDYESALAGSSPITITATLNSDSVNKLCCEFDTTITDTSSFDHPASYELPPPSSDESGDYNIDNASPEFTRSFTVQDGGDTVEFQLQVYDDDCQAEDEKFGFELSNDEWCAVGANSLEFTILNDDVTYCWKDLSLSVNENTGVVRAVLQRYGYLGRETVAYVRTVETGAGSTDATSDVDFEALHATQPNGMITFGVGVTEVPIDIVILDDTDCEIATANDETFILRYLETESDGKICENSDGATLEDVEITILHDDVVLQFQLPSYDVSETSGTVEVVVEFQMQQPVDRAVTVDVRVQPLNPTDTADPGVDYIPSNIDSTLTIPAGRTTASLTVSVNDDLVVEADEEKFQLILVANSEPVCVPVAPASTPQDTTDIEIHDDDCYLRFDPPQLTLREGVDTYGVTTILCERDENSMATIHFPMTAILSISTDNIVSQSTASSETDYTVLRTEVAITGTSTDVTIFRLIDDILEETPEYLEVSLLSVDDGELAPPETLPIEILDNDVTVQIASCGDNNRVLESVGQVTVTVKRTGDLTSADSVLILTTAVTAQPDFGSGGGDYVHVNDILYFAPMESTITENIQINNDIVLEGDEEFTVQIQRQNAQTNVDSTLDICRVTIADDDCSFHLSLPDDVNIVPESDKQASVIIRRTGNLDKGAIVSIQTSDVTGGHSREATADDDYTSVSREISFGPDDDTQTVIINIEDDNKQEFTEYFQVQLTDGDCGINAGSQLIIGIEDDDGVVISLRDSEITVNEDDESACAILQRSGSVERTDVVSLSVTPRAIPGSSTAATGGSDFDDSDFTVTFEQDQVEKEACVPIYKDGIEEGLESFSVRINRAEQQGGQGSSGLLATIDNDNRETVIFIRDDDGTLQLSCPNNRVSESTGTVTCIIERSGSDAQSQVAYVSTGNGDAISLSDFEPLSGKSVSFPSGADSVPFNVKIFDDKEVEGSEDFFVFLVADDSSGTDLGQAASTITIIDDDNSLKFETVSGVGQITDTTITVEESVRQVRLTVLREAYGFNVPTGTTTARVETREINPGDAGAADPADGNDVDYIDINTEVTFRTGQRRIDVEIEITDDEIGEKQEAFEVVLTEVTPDSNNVIVYPYRITVYINDDDGGLSDDGGVGDGDGNEDDGLGGLPRPLIVGIGGGLGLLLLLGVLGLIGCVAFSRWNQSRAAPSTLSVSASRARPPVQGPPQFGAPRAQPPAYNPYQVNNGRGARGPPPIYYR